MTKTRNRAAAAALALVASVAAHGADAPFDLVIRNARIVDGTEVPGIAVTWRSVATRSSRSVLPSQETRSV
jgi:hypothetical protein